MKAINQPTGKEFEIVHVKRRQAGYGHKIIGIEYYYKGKEDYVYNVTNDMPRFDKAMELEGEEKQLAMYKLIEVWVEDQIAEHINYVDAE